MADYIHFADHIVVLCQVVRVNIQGQNLFAAFTTPDTFLEGVFSLCLPLVVLIYIQTGLLYPKETHSMW
jgi:hypothetical protein